MWKSTSLVVHIVIIVTTGMFIFSVFPTVGLGQSGIEPEQKDDLKDLSQTEKLVPPGTPESSPLTIKLNGDQTRLKLKTKTPVSPYLGAVKKTDAYPEGMFPQLSSRTDNPLNNYHLETGVGLRVNSKAKVNLGYRFDDSRSLLDTLNRDDRDGEVRFSLEIKLPF